MENGAECRTLQKVLVEHSVFLLICGREGEQDVLVPKTPLFFQGAKSSYSVFVCPFVFAVENGGQTTRGRSASQQVAGKGHTFFFQSIWSKISQLPKQSRSSVTQSRAFRTDQGCQNKKTTLPISGEHEQW